MKNLLVFTLFSCLIMSCNDQKSDKNKENARHGPITLVIHGGAGTITKENMTPEKEKAYQEALVMALDTGYAILERGGKSVDAVIASIKVLEDNPLFNAGRGSVFTNEGKNELDASIMDGSNLMAGAVAGVTTIKNPIAAAHAVMSKSQHVMMTGKGAETFANEQGLEIVDPSYFFDTIRFRQLQKLKERETGKEASLDTDEPLMTDEKFGTVGAVALDQFGNLAAGTSTGGMNNKRWGRIGDSPIIGAGTYANNATCAVSATGHGEFFIRLAVAHDISAQMEYKDIDVKAAAEEVIMSKLKTLGGNGGIIALDRKGNFTMTFNSEGMFRGFIQKRGEAKTYIYKD